MPIAQSQLQSAAQRRVIQESLKYPGNYRTAFLCHSHHDRLLAEGLQAILSEQGVTLYIDWKDSSMPLKPSRQTAERLQERIRGCDWFLFLATANSMSSRWCPWELGYADGVKELDRIAIVQTSEGGQVHGNEYLELYRRIDTTAAGELLWMPVGSGSTTGKYVRTIPFI